MTWNEYLWFAIPAILCWLIAGVLVFRTKKAILIEGFMVLGIVIFGSFIAGLWIGQE